MIEANRVTVTDPALLDGFLARWTRSGLPAVPRVLLALARSPDSIIDIHDGGGRALLAVVTDGCDNSGDAAELVLLACRDHELGAASLAACLDAAIDVAIRGPHGFLELAATATVRAHEVVLRARGLARRFDSVSMTKRRAHAPVATSFPWHWSDVAADDLAALSDLSRAAFRGHPGVNFAPPAALDALVVRRVPPIRLLRDGTTVVGSVSVRRDEDGAGLIEIVQRHPDHAGRGLGPVLMTEALRQLELMSCVTIGLDAAAENRRALALYRRFGFVVTDTVPVYAVATG